MNSRKFYIYNTQKLAKMNVKKIGFFTFAFSPGAVSDGGALDRGLFYNFFSIPFSPQSHTCSTHRPYSKISSPPLTTTPIIPLTTPLYPYPIPPQSTPLSIQKQRNFATNHNINISSQKQIQTPTQ